MATVNYSSLERVKEYIVDVVAPKYFNMDEVNDLNVGLLGMNVEIHSNTTEDTFNALSMYVKEAFPNLAQLPESLYNYAATLDIDDLFAIPSQVKMVLFLKEQDIIQKGTTNSSSMINFVLDKSIVIDVDGVPFSPEYDIVVTAKPNRGDYIYTAQYDMTYKNSISSETIPYLQTVRVPIDNTSYLGILVTKARQVTRTVKDEVILDNDVVNNTTITVEYQDQLAGFDVFYRPPGASKYTQLTKKIYGGTPLKSPFCFYRLKDDNTYQITFTMMDNYFQPEFNGDIRVVTYTTKGSDGNFSEYKGQNITAVPSSDTYDYNNGIIVMALPQGAAVNGQPAIGLEDLRSIIVERWASSGAYNIESDLQLYLENYARRNKTNLLFVKKRDDLIERLFSSFSLFKDFLGDYYPSNSLYLKLFEEDFDNSFEQDGRSTVNAGAIFTYDGSSTTTAKRIPGTINDVYPSNQFTYTNPFVISVQKSPSIVGFYLNSINKKIGVDYTHVNINSYYQFISNTISIKRNSLMGDKAYTIKGTFVPATQLPEDLLIVPEGSPEGTKPAIFDKLKIVIAINENGTDTSYKEMTVTEVGSDGMIYAECSFETDDTITQDEKIRFSGLHNIEDGAETTKIVPMIDCTLNIYTLFKYDTPVDYDHSIFTIKGFEGYTLTNRYTTQTESVSFMVPMNMIRSKCKLMPYKKDNGEGGFVDSFYYLVELVPLIKYNAINSSEKFDEFITLLHDIHTYLSAIMQDITTNYNIDMKFYNTYGRSANFVVGENEEILDRVNISIEFKVTPKLGVVTDNLVPRLKAFIKEYIENTNNLVDSNIKNKGYNAVYISNLMRMIENTFVDEIDHHQFVRINDYDSSVQIIENKTVDMSTLTQAQRRSYVPEYLTISMDDIKIGLVYK